MHVRVHVCMHVHAHTNTCLCVQGHVRVRAQARVQVQVQARTQACDMQENALVCTWASSTYHGPFCPVFWFFDFV